MKIDKCGKFIFINTDEEFVIMLNNRVYGPFKLSRLDYYINSLS